MSVQDQTPDLDWREGGIPVSQQFNDPYFSLNGGLDETRHVFLAGNDLPARLHPGFHVAELGFGTGLNLLDYAEKLILHPKALPSTDKSEDFIVPLAATAGAISYAYKLDEERIFNVEFKGYPNSTTGLLFQIGDESA